MKNIIIVCLVLTGSALAEANVCEVYKNLQTAKLKPGQQVGVTLKFTPTVQSSDVFKVVDVKGALYAYSAIDASGQTVVYRPPYDEKPSTDRDPGSLLVYSLGGFPEAKDTKAFWFFYVYDFSKNNWSFPKIDAETFAGVGDYAIKDGDMIALVLQRSGYSSTKDSGLPDLSKCPK